MVRFFEVRQTMRSAADPTRRSINMAGQIKILGQLWSGQVAMTQGRAEMAPAFSPERGDMKCLRVRVNSYLRAMRALAVHGRPRSPPLAPCSLRRVPEAAVRLIPASARGPEPLMDLESMGAIICNQLGLMARLTLT